MKIAICDDEEIFALSVKKQVEDFCKGKDTEVDITVYTKAQSLLSDIESGKAFDVLFLDINLGTTRDGIAVASYLREQGNDTPIIFVTSYESRAVDGYDTDAFGFIVKKNAEEKLPRVMEKLWNRLYVKNTVAVCEKDTTTLVNIRDILFAESDGRSTKIHTVNGEMSDSRSIGTFSALLGEMDFVEVYKSIFVNISRIRRINSDTVTVENGDCVPLSRRNRKNVMYAVMRKVNGK